MLTKSKIFKPLISFFASLLLFNGLQAQVSISGPSCVAPGIEYQYTISGGWNSGTSMDWCVTGGTITGYGTCKSGTPWPQIYVIFTSGTGRKIDLTTSIGNATLNITIVPVLLPGTIPPPTSQNIYWGQMAGQINCPIATGGSCSTPVNTYQWQQSTDNVNFTDIIGATNQNLPFTSGPFSTTYYRRKVTVSPEGTIGYSNTYTVFVAPPLNGGVISTANQVVEYPAVPIALTTSVGSGGGCSSFTYIWEESNDNVTFTAISPAVTTQNLASPNPTRSRYYRRKVSCTGPQIGYSNTVYVIVVFKPGTLSASQSILPGGAVTALSLSGTIGGFGTSYSYQWEKSTDEINWTIVKWCHSIVLFSAFTFPYYLLQG